jgi:Domain of unknown function (DUF4124)
MGEKHMSLSKKPETLITVVFTALICLSFQSPSYAKVYKWVDENGQVHYGEQPGNADAERVTIRQNETTEPRTIKKDEDDTKDKAENDAATEAPKLVEQKIPAKEKRRLCKEAKSDIAAINSRGQMREINAKGEYVYLPDEQKQQRLATAKKKARKYCR